MHGRNRSAATWIENSAKSLLRGLESFHVGYSHVGFSQLKSSQKNLSCLDHPEVVDKYIKKECGLKRQGLFLKDLLPLVYTIAFGLILKKFWGQWHLIVDLLSPHRVTMIILVIHYGGLHC